MSSPLVRSISVFVGAVPMVIAGAVAADWWWLAAAAGAAAAVGAAFDRQLCTAQVLATLAVVIGLDAAGASWFVPLLVAGTVASIELGAAADRATIIRPRVPDLERIVPTAALSVAVAAVVLTAGRLPVVVASVTVVVAASAAVVATRVIAR